MNELASVASAQDFRQLHDRLKRNDEVRGGRQHSQNIHFLKTEHQNDLIEFDAQLREKRIQDRREIIEREREGEALYRERQDAFERITKDETFLRHRNAAIANVNSIRDNRELNENLLQQNIAETQNNADRLLTLEQRNENFREHEIERDARLTERHIQERADARRQTASVSHSIERIFNHGSNNFLNEETPRGSIVDIVG